MRMEFKDFYEILKRNIEPDATEDQFFLTLFENIMRDPTDEQKAKATEKKPYYVFAAMERDTLERYCRGQLDMNVKKLGIVYGARDPHKFARYIGSLSKEVQGNIEEDFCTKIPGFADEDNNLLGYALADLFIGIIHDGMDRTKKKAPKRASASDPGYYIHEIYYDPEHNTLHVDGRVYVLPKELTPPDNIDEEENKYLTALLEAYTPVNGEAVTLDSLQLLKTRLRNHFSEQRSNYYSALRIIHIIRDCFANADEEQSRWLNGTESYISDVRQDIYDNGYRRLMAVLAKVVDCKTISAVDQCNRLIDARERKGACHLLVNQGRFVWVDEDDA